MMDLLEEYRSMRDLLCIWRNFAYDFRVFEGLEL